MSAIVDVLASVLGYTLLVLTCLWLAGELIPTGRMLFEYLCHRKAFKAWLSEGPK